MANLNKKELINILVEEFGYEKEDLKFDAEGKPYTNGKLQLLIEAEKEDAKELENQSTRKVAVVSKIKDDERIVIMSGVDSVSYFSERTNRKWQFSEFGQEDVIEYSELVSMRNKHPKYFTEGSIIILNEKVQDEFRLTELYKNILTPDNISDVFSMDIEKLEEFVDKLPESQKRTFVSYATNQYDKGELTDLRIVRFIQEKFNFSFDDNAPLNDIAQSVDTGVHNIIYVDKR